MFTSNQFTTIIIICIFPLLGFSQLPKNEARLSADMHHELGNYEKAIELYAQAIKKETDAQAYINRASCFLAKGLENAAIQDYLESEKLEKGKASFDLAKIYAKNGNKKEAVFYLKRHLKSSFRHTETKLNETFYDYDFYGTDVDISDFYTKVELLLNEAKYEIDNNNFENALEKLDEISFTYPNNANAYYLRAKLVFEKDAKWAKKEIKQALKLQKKEYSLVLGAKIDNKFGNYKAALKNIQLAINKNPYKLDYYLVRGRAYIGLNQTDNAEADIDMVLKYKSNDANIMHEAGMLYFDNADYSKSLKIYNQLLSKVTSKAEYFLARGNVFLKAGNYEKAKYDFAMALDLEPFNHEAYFKQGIADFELGKTESAFYFWTKARRLGNKEASAYLLKHFPGR